MSGATCFGYAVRSELALEYVRAGDGPALDVAVGADGAARPGDRLLLEWLPTELHPQFHARLYADERRYRLWTSGTGSGWFVVDPDGPSITVPETAGPVRREERLWGLPALLCVLHRGDLPLHAAAIEVGGEALLLAAPSAFGKTTLVAAALAAGYRHLAEDLSCVRLGAGRPTVVPGPAMLRLRPDVAAALDVPKTTRLDESDGRVHLAIDPAARGDSTPVPIRALVLLQPTEGRPLLADVDPRAALRDLWALAFRLPSEEDRSRCFHELGELAARVRLRRLAYPARIESLPETVELLARRA